MFAYVQLPALYRQYTTYAWCHPPWPRRVEIIVMRGPRPLPYSVDTLGMGVAAIKTLHMHGAHSVKTQHDVKSLFAHVQQLTLYRQDTTYAWNADCGGNKQEFRTHSCMSASPPDGSLLAQQNMRTKMHPKATQSRP